MESYPEYASMIHGAALKIAGRGKPVFPCKPDKSPYTPHGFKDATTNRARVNAFWNRHRGAKIGMPAGAGSGVWVLDVDRPAALGELPREMPETLTVRTPGGGLHFYFNHVAGLTNRTGGLPEGIDVRAEGGYVIVPPSPGYVVERRAPIADAPAWLLDLVREKPAGPRKDAGGVHRADGVPRYVLGDGPIAAGRRNRTLASIAGRLRARGYDREAIEEELSEVNAARCAPPLEEGEVRRIAASISRYAPGEERRGPDSETLAAVEELERELWRREWRGVGGKSERDAFVVALGMARRSGTLIPGGVRFEVDIRSWALAAAVSKRAMLDYRRGEERKPGIVSRLKRRGLLRSDNTGRRDGERSAFVLVLPRAEGRAQFHHSTNRESCGGGGETLRAPRLRWSATSRERVGSEWETFVTLRLGKTAGAVVDVLERAGGIAAIPEIADVLGLERTRDLRRRTLARLEERGIVTVAGDTVTLVPDWLEALNREREASGEIAAYRRDMARYAREREAYRTRHERPADPAPTEAEVRERREGAPERRRGAIEGAIARLFRERPEYRGRRVGQITCALVTYGLVPDDFPRGVPPGGPPKDREVAAILGANGAEAA